MYIYIYSRLETCGNLKFGPDKSKTVSQTVCLKSVHGVIRPYEVLQSFFNCFSPLNTTTLLFSFVCQLLRCVFCNCFGFWERVLNSYWNFFGTPLELFGNCFGTCLLIFRTFSELFRDFCGTVSELVLDCVL